MYTHVHNIHSIWLMSRSLPLRNYVGRGPVDVILKSSDCAQMIFGIVRKALWESMGLEHHFQ